MKRLIPILCIALAGCLRAQTPTSTMATGTQLANEASARIAADQAEATARANAIAAEATARAAADTTHATDIATNATAITAEATTRAAADTTHAADIVTNAAAITAEANRATAAETDLSTGLAGKQPLAATLTSLASASLTPNSILIGGADGTPSFQAVSASRFPVRGASGSIIMSPITDNGITLLSNTYSGMKSALALDQVNNTGDENKPVSTATQAALNAKAGIAGAGITDPAAFRSALQQGYQSKKDQVVINVMDYGVIPNDGLDDTTAMQAALNAAADTTKPSVVQMPAGEIRLTAELSVSGPMIVKGTGGRRTVVRQYTAGANGFVLSAAHYHVSFEDFELVGPDATSGDGATSGVGLLMDSKAHTGEFIGGPLIVKNMAIARWYTCLRVGQYHTWVENTHFGSYSKGVILVSTDVFMFQGCAIGAESDLGPTVSTCTSITLLGATIDAYVTSGGGNFAGSFIGCEIGGAWRILETDDQAKVRFESCNIECGNSFSSGSEKLFAVKGGARVEVSNCRFGIAFTGGSSGTETTPTPAAIFGCDATNVSASAKLTLKNNTIDPGSYYQICKVVGDSYGDSYPQVVGRSIPIKIYNAAGTLKATIPFYSATFVPLDRVTMEYSVPPTHASSLPRRGLFNIREADDGDSTAGDDMPTFTRKTRKKLSGVVQYSRDHLLPAMTQEVLASSSTVTANGASATESALPAYTVPEGQLIGNGDRFLAEFRGTCLANANTKTVQYLLGGDSYASLTIEDASAVAWKLTVDVFGDSSSILRGFVSLQAWDSSGAKVTDKTVRVSKGASNGDKAVSMKISSSATGDITTEGWRMSWWNGATKY
jgi:hypothetical protein